MADVMISYRRSDSAAIAGRIRDRLAQYYGADAIFMDIDGIPLGIDFRQQIQEAVTQNDILLALIGPPPNLSFAGASRSENAGSGRAQKACVNRRTTYPLPQE